MRFDSSFRDARHGRRLPLVRSMRAGSLLFGMLALVVALSAATVSHAEDAPKSAPEAPSGTAEDTPEDASDVVENGAENDADRIADDVLVADPFETANRAIYRFNGVLDRYLAEPVADGYRYVTPAFARQRLRDFLDNLKTPVWFFNEALQGHWDDAGRQAARFSLNTTLGVAGAYDFAADVADIEKESEDFGQTLAVWGVDQGPYLVVPLLGPATTRDFVGGFVDGAMDPFLWMDYDHKEEFLFARTTADIVDARARADEVVALIRESLDPYAQTRALYIQSRRAGLAEDDAVYDDLPEFD